MLPSINRLSKQEISDVMRFGTRVYSKELELKYKKTNTDSRLRGNDNPRFTIVVSTKIDKRATRRNRIRRIISESLRHLLPTIESIHGVILVRKNISEMTQSDVQILLKTLFHEISRT